MAAVDNTCDLFRLVSSSWVDYDQALDSTMMKIPLSLFFAGLLWIPGCIQNVRAEEIADDPVRNGVRLSRLQTHAVRSITYWQRPDQLKPRQINIGPAPPELIEFMHLDNAFQGYSERPVPVSRDSAILRDVDAAMASLPRAIRRIAERRLFYIALVRDLGGSNTQNIAGNGFYVLSWTHPPPSQTTVMPGDINRSRFDDAWPAEAGHGGSTKQEKTGHHRGFEETWKAKLRLPSHRSSR